MRKVRNTPVTTARRIPRREPISSFNSSPAGIISARRAMVAGLLSQIHVVWD
jgi:hypothetical protein